MSDFFQAPPLLSNTYHSNRWLKSYLKNKLPAETFATIDRDLERLGESCAGPYLELARRAEREKPVHIPFDAWGKRIDQIRVSTAWEELQNISAREGLVAIGYERKWGEFSRLYQFSKLYLFHPSSAFFTCPLAMADGAAKVLETYGREEVHRETFRHLTTRDPAQFWTSGQWMTEKTGGSDVSGTGTEARIEDGKTRLYGTKWFSSATTSQVALALARKSGSQLGSKGLTLFLAKTYAHPGELNHIQVLRLKDKLGTWALPTAELALQGSFAAQVGETDCGVKTVASMLNITRLYNSVCSIGQMTRALEQMRDYSDKRIVFGQALSAQPLHYSTFAGEELRGLAAFLLTFEMVHLLGKEECKTASTNELEILRLMTPVCKLFTARVAIDAASEVIEGFGGAGYCEDTGLPVHLRDSQVFPIWEGATNVLSLDLIRVMQRGRGLQALLDEAARRSQEFKSPATQSAVRHLQAVLKEFAEQFAEYLNWPAEAQVASSRDLAFFLGRLYSYVLLLSWLDQETSVNQKILSVWATQFAQTELGHWHPTPSETLTRSREMWTGRLKT